MGARLHQSLGDGMMCHVCWNGGGVADSPGNPEALGHCEGAHGCT